MTQASTYALLSGNAYWDIRKDPENRAPIPEGWSVLTQFDSSNSGDNATLLGSGFSARVYQGPGGEIVIAYAGTEFGNNITGLVNDFLSGNLPLAAGFKSDQAYQAARCCTSRWPLCTARTTSPSPATRWAAAWPG